MFAYSILPIIFLFLILILLIGIFWLSRSNTNSNTSTSTETQSLEAKNYIVVLKDDKSCPRAKIGEICSLHGIKHNHDDDVFEHGFKGFSAKLTSRQLEQFKKHPDIKHVEEDIILSLPPKPTKVPPLTIPQGQLTPWNVKREGGVYTKSVNTNVFVIDTGIAPHPDLNIVSSRSFVPGSPLGHDQNGHGTNVAGIIGARNNNIAVVGVAPGCQLHSVQVLDANGSGSLSQVIQGVQYVTNLKKTTYANVPVVANMSLGMYTGTTAYNSLDLAVDAAIKAGVVMCIAAGNSSDNASYYSPAHVAGAIVVGSYGQSGKFSYFSNYGRSVCILGPGENCTSCGLNGGLSTMSGTSMASPGVAGWCADFLSSPSNANKTPAQVKAAIQAIIPSANNPTITGVPLNTPNKSIYI